MSMSDCIEYKGSKCKGGYGRVSRIVGGKRTNLAVHRIAYAERHGEIPAGLFVCHKCDNRACINPDHLFLGTHKENMRDMAVKGRANKPEGCKNPKAKLCEQDIPRIRDMIACGCTNVEIGKWFGVGNVAISRIRLGTTWAHVA